MDLWSKLRRILQNRSSVTRPPCPRRPVGRPVLRLPRPPHPFPAPPRRWEAEEGRWARSTVREGAEGGTKRPLTSIQDTWPCPIAAPPSERAVVEDQPGQPRVGLGVDGHGL